MGIITLLPSVFYLEDNAQFGGGSIKHNLKTVCASINKFIEAKAALTDSEGTGVAAPSWGCPKGPIWSQADVTGQAVLSRIWLWNHNTNRFLPSMDAGNEGKHSLLQSGGEAEPHFPALAFSSLSTFPVPARCTLQSSWRCTPKHSHTTALTKKKYCRIHVYLLICP